MIKKIWSTLSSFREIEFKPGMNIVLADRTDDSDETGSTNGLGKTTLLRIIRFCLGSDLKSNKVLTHPKLNDISFGLSFIYAEELIEVIRNTTKPDEVWVTTKFIEGTDFSAISTSGNNSKIKLSDFKEVLSLRFIGVATENNHAPSFNEVLLYFVRVSKAAFSSPETAFQGQPAASKRRCTSYLLNLNWSSQQTLEAQIGSRKKIDETIKTLQGAETAAGQKTIGELESERVALKGEIDEEKEKIENFNIRDDYQDLQERLKSTDEDLHRLININHSDERLLQNYKKSAKSIPNVDPKKPIEILENAGAIFKKEVIRELVDIANFHEEVHKNRSEFLKNEIKRIKIEIKNRKDKINNLTDEKTKTLQLLQSSGALDTLIELQRSYTEKISKYEALNGRLVERKRFDILKDELTADINKERALMKRDLNDRQKTVDEARKLFAQYTKFLYGEPGALNVNINASGYTFTFSIDREGSDGIDQMVVFCFDLTIATIRARRKAKFQTLIHDSTLFADVDPRQYGLALQLAETTSKLEGFQYICCLNAGALPLEHLGELNLTSYTRMRLTDENAAKGLLGIRLPSTDLPK